MQIFHSFGLTPERGVVKVNFDAGVDVRSRRGGLGVVIRDSLGRFSPLPEIVDPLTAEALAAREGLLFALFCNQKKIQLEGDSLKLIRML